MKKLFTITALLLNLSMFCQSFKDGNYKFSIDYLTDLISNRELEGVKSVILHSSKNKVIINSINGAKTFTIKSKAVSHDGDTEGDMEYRLIGDTDKVDYLIIFKHRTSKTYSINLSASSNVWWEFHIVKVTLF